MRALKRLAIGFPLQWSHRRACSLEAIAQPGVLLRWYYPILISKFALHRFCV